MGVVVAHQLRAGCRHHEASISVIKNVLNQKSLGRETRHNTKARVQTNHVLALLLVFDTKDRPTLTTSRSCTLAISGNLMWCLGLMMARIFSIWLRIDWKGVRPYTIRYRIHPNDHTSLL